MRIIGTAGHVDHGKSTLVKRLTGIDPDRLAEEKARQMTIDLGFAWFDLPQAGRVGVVDVPGHRDFIENMLAGIGGIDLALLIIAADEGVMPQTREHLAILDLLPIDRTLVLLTKIDLINDADWLALIETDIRTVLDGTRLAAAPLIGVSAHTGAGMEALRAALDSALSDLPPRAVGGLLRLPVDRAFTLSGFGTVVTGTLRGDALHLGEDVMLLPSGLTSRVRGLHSYDQPVAAAQPGSRTAVNLAGIDKNAVKRGDLLVRPGSLTPTTLIDVQYRHLPDANGPLKHNAPIKLFCGTAEITGTVRVLAGDSVEPGTAAWLQIALDRPLAAAEGDSYILRRPSPPQTIGGGRIVRLYPAKKWKRNDPGVLAGFTRLSEQQAAAARVAAAVSTDEPRPSGVVQITSQLRGDAFTAALNDALTLNLIVAIERPGGTVYWNAECAARLRDRLRREVSAYHAAHPLRPGIPREELRNRLKLKADALAALIDTDPALAVTGTMIRLIDHQISFSREQAAQAAALRAALEAAPFTPPGYTEAAAATSAEIVHALIDLGEIVRVSTDTIFSRAAYDALVSGVLDRLAADGTVTVAVVRDTFQTSRKYALALLEHLDTIGVTRRQGDQRVRGSR